MHIIAFTDDPDILNILREISLVEANGFMIHSESNDALDVIALIIQQNPVLLLIDDDFFKSRSARLLRSLRKLLDHLKIILISSESKPEFWREVIELGVNYHDIKPVQPKDLKQSIYSLANIKGSEKINH